MRHVVFIILTGFNFCNILNAQPIDWEVYQGRSPYDLNKNEIRDSGFHSLLIHTLYSDHIGNENWRDTQYVARFDMKGRTIYEKRKNLLVDSTINEFFYNEKGQLIKTTCRRYYLIGSKSDKTFIIESQYKEKLLTHTGYIILLSGNKPIYKNKKFEYNKLGKLIRMLEESTESRYSYDNFGRLSKEEYKMNDSSSIFYQYIYEFNGTDSTVSVSAIEQYGKKIDSTDSKKVYNIRGQVLLETRKVSPTYYKTFPTDCSTGETYTNTYQYDEMGRKTSDGNYNFKYYDFGYIKKPQYGKAIVCFVSEGIDNGRLWVLETEDITTKLKTYLSEKSGLLLSIDRMDGRYGNEKVFFEYSK